MPLWSRPGPAARAAHGEGDGDGGGGSERDAADDPGDRVGVVGARAAAGSDEAWRRRWRRPRPSPRRPRGDRRGLRGGRIAAGGGRRGGCDGDRAEGVRRLALDGHEPVLHRQRVGAGGRQRDVGAVDAHPGGRLGVEALRRTAGRRQDDGRRGPGEQRLPVLADGDVDRPGGPGGEPVRGRGQPRGREAARLRRPGERERRGGQGGDDEAPGPAGGAVDGELFHVLGTPHRQTRFPGAAPRRRRPAVPSATCQDGRVADGKEHHEQRRGPSRSGVRRDRAAARRPRRGRLRRRPHPECQPEVPGPGLRRGRRRRGRDPNSWPRYYEALAPTSTCSPSSPGARTRSASMRGTGGGRSLIFNGHVDVVPPGDPANWKSGDPFSGRIDDDRVWGRGATDMKGGILAQAFAAQALGDAGRPTAGRPDPRGRRRRGGHGPRSASPPPSSSAATAPTPPSSPSRARPRPCSPWCPSPRASGGSP